MARWSTRQAMLVLVGANLLWAGSYTAGKEALRALSPLELNGMRFAIAGVILLPLLSSNSEAGLYDLVVRTLVERAFEFAERNQVRAAASLGITRNVLRTHLARYGMLASARGQRRHLPE